MFPFDLLKVVRPNLHHSGTFLEKFRAIVGASERIRHLVGKLVLDDFRLLVQFFVQDCSRHGTEPMTSDFGLGVVAHAAQCRIDGSITHAFLWVSAREYMLAVPSERL